MSVRIIVGEGSCGLAAGAGAVYTALENALTPEVPAALGITGCIGICYLEPIVDVYDAEGTLHRCVRVKPEDAETIVSAVKANDYAGLADLLIQPEDEAFLTQQTRIALRHCGLIDPENIDDYTAGDGYKALPYGHLVEHPALESGCHAEQADEGGDGDPASSQAE